MSNKVDKLFKEKLEGDTLQPSAQAWEKVEAHLGKKNKMVLWARVAAAVILLGLLMFVSLNWNDDELKKEVVKEEPGVESQEPEVKEPKTEQAPTIAEAPKKVRQQNRQPNVVPPVVDQPVEQVAITPEPQLELRLNVVETELTAHNPQPTTQKGITLTYSLPAVKKQEATSEPLVAEQKKTGFERVIEIAKEVKTGEALGELRQAKDDIFALDFRKDKNKKQ